MDYIGVIIGILSLLVTMLIGWQIYNAVTIEKKIKDEVKQISNTLKDKIKQAHNALNESIEKTQEDLSISSSRNITRTLFTIEKYYVRNCISVDNYMSSLEGLERMFQHAISLNESDIFNDMAKAIIETKDNIPYIDELSEKDIVYKSLGELSQSIIKHLPGLNTEILSLLTLIQKSKEEYKSVNDNPLD